MHAGILQICILTVAALLSVGCTRVLRMDPGGWGLEPTVSEDGLYRVPATEVGAAFLRPGARFADYRAVLIDPCTLAYKSPPTEQSIFRREIGNYRLSPESSERLTRGVREALQREVDASESFYIAGEPGPGVLLVSCHIVGLIWEVPDARGGETFWTKSTGAMTLILNLRDSESGAVLGRLADRRAIRPEGVQLSGGYENRPVNNWAGVREVSARWGRILREALDVLHAQQTVPDVDVPASAASMLLPDTSTEPHEGSL